MSTSGNSTRSARGGRGRGRSSYRGGYRPNNNNNNSTSRSTSTSTTNEKTQYLMGNKGSKSFRKVNEELLIETNTKYGADMGYIMLNEEVPPFPVIELAKPTTTLAQISAAADENLKAELMAQRELEERANEVVFNQRNDYRVKQEKMRKKDMGKLCGIIRGRLSDPVLVKLQEDPKFNEYQLGDPDCYCRRLRYMYDLQGR